MGAADKLGMTPLSYASNHNNIALVTLLLGAGAPIDVKDSKSLTPLLRAVIANAVDTVTLLLKAGANSKATDVKGRNIFLAAAAYNAARVLSLLLSQFTCTSEQLYMLLYTAAEHTATDVLELLLQRDGLE